MYRNLEAEMARHGVKRKDLAELLGVRYATIIDRLNGKYRFYYDEAYKIKKEYFPDLEIEYLFSNEESATQEVV